MELLPRTLGTRPRVAVEVRPEGIVAARSEESAGALAAVSRGELREGALSPGLRPGNVPDGAAVSAMVRRVLDGVAARSGERSKYVTLIVPDAAVRVLLLDFDALPGKAAEALAVVRFRLKKLLPFDAEHAVVSYQVMSSGRDGVRVLAVAMPCDVLAEYEGLVTAAGYQPGAVLPSTLAALAGLDSLEAGAAPVLLVNAGPFSVTTAIVQGGLLLLHRTVDMRTEMVGVETAGGVRAAEPGPGEAMPGVRLPVTTGQESQQVRPPQRPVDPADFDRLDAETAMQAGVLRSELNGAVPTEADEAVKVLNETDPASAGREVTQAVSVAAAYFEDTLGGAPPVVLAAGTMGAERLGAILSMYGMDGLRVREMVEPAPAGVSTGGLPRGWLAGVQGALRS